MWHSIYNSLNLHVGESERCVIRATLQKLKPRSRYARTSRTQRHELLREMLREHLEARELYRDVMSGRVG